MWNPAANGQVASAKTWRTRAAHDYAYLDLGGRFQPERRWRNMLEACYKNRKLKLRGREGEGTGAFEAAWLGLEPGLGFRGKA